MATASVVKETSKDEKLKLRKEISALKKGMTDFKVQRKSEWKAFKNKFFDNIEKVEKSLKKLNDQRKK